MNKTKELLRCSSERLSSFYKRVEERGNLQKKKGKKGDGSIFEKKGVKLPQFFRKKEVKRSGKFYFLEEV